MSKNLVPLSEQNLIDCSTRFGNQGCNGGSVEMALEYIMAEDGLDAEASYPYEGRSGSCRYNPANSALRVAGYVRIPSHDEAMLQAVVATIGPISVNIHAGESFQSPYTGESVMYSGT